jgi:WD40 repeat protein
MLGFVWFVVSALAAPFAGAAQVSWMKRYDRPAPSVDAAVDVALSPNGSDVFVTGMSEGPGLDSFITIAYDATTGDRLWTKRLATGYTGEAITVAPDGATVYVSGAAHREGVYVFATVAYDASTGAALWTRFNTGGWLKANAVTPDGAELLVAGIRVSSHEDFKMIAYDAVTGLRLWSSRYDGPSSQSDIARDIAVSPDGRTFFVTGESQGGAEVDEQYGYATVALDAATGARRWVARFENGNSEAVAISPDGSTVFVTGAGLLPQAAATAAYDASTGAELWKRQYAGPSGQFGSASSLAISPGGTTLYVTGVDGPDQNENMLLLAYDASTGESVWTKHFDDAVHLNDWGSAVGVAPDGSRVFVTGVTDGPKYGTGTTSNYATFAYDAPTGSRLWTKVYNGTGNGTDEARALAVVPDGSGVIVTGESTGHDLLETYPVADFETIRYAG